MWNDGDFAKQNPIVYLDIADVEQWPPLCKGGCLRSRLGDCNVRSTLFALQTNTIVA